MIIGVQYMGERKILFSIYELKKWTKDKNINNVYITIDL